MNAFVRYAVAVAMTAIAMVLTHSLAEYLHSSKLLFLWVAVLLTAVIAGTGPALLTIALSVGGMVLGFVDPVGSLLVGRFVDLVPLALFVLFSGGISFAVGLRRDAAERARRLSDQLTASEQRYRTLVEATPYPQAVWISTPDGQITWSEPWGAITGLTPEELASGGAMEAVHAEDRERSRQLWEEAREKGRRYEDEFRVRVADGRYRWFAVKAVPVYAEDGAVREWVGIIVDIHARKRHDEDAAFINRASEMLSSSLGYEQTLRNLARLCVPELGDWCVIDLGDATNRQRIVIEHSDPEIAESIRQLSASAASEGSGPVVEVLRTGETQLVENVTDEILERSVADARQLEVARALGLRSWIVAPMIAHGRTLGALSLACTESDRHYSLDDVPLVEDLARRAAMAIDNARLYEAAEAANRAKDEFLATLSHELRTPLTAITGWAHMLELGMTDEQTTRVAIDTIVRSARTQTELIDDLLDLSRVVAGTLQLNIETVDLAQLVREVAVGARPAADAKELELDVGAPDEPVLVRGDERRLRQIIWNLITNAVKFTDSGGSVRATVSVAHPMAQVEVTDTGRGIDPEFIPFVWDRFRQADSSTSRKYGGLGLGLSVVRHLIELHGGTVEAESEGPGKGSRFAVAIPLARGTDSRQAEQPPAAERRTLDAMRVLVVDDDPDARVMLATMLRQLGASVTTAISAEEAMASLAAGNFEAVVSDIAMPGEDGYALVRRIRAQSEIPVIAVSAIGTSADDRRRALEAGFAEFVRKPVVPQEISRAIGDAMSRSQPGE
jgi:PAS domain S-box-containing protein